MTGGRAATGRGKEDANESLAACSSPPPKYEANESLPSSNDPPVANDTEAEAEAEGSEEDEK